MPTIILTNEIPVSGRAYRVCTNVDRQEWRKYSFWTLAEDIEMANGLSLQTLINLLNIDSTGRVEKAVTAMTAESTDLAAFASEADKAYVVEDVSDATISGIVPVTGSTPVMDGDSVSEAMAKINARFDAIEAMLSGT